MAKINLSEQIHPQIKTNATQKFGDLSEQSRSQ